MMDLHGLYMEHQMPWKLRAELDKQMMEWELSPESDSLSKIRRLISDHHHAIIQEIKDEEGQVTALALYSLSYLMQELTDYLIMRAVDDDPELIEELILGERI